MPNRDAATAAKEVFRLFAQLTRLPVKQDTIEQKLDSPDIFCRLENGEAVTYELVTLDSERSSQTWGDFHSMPAAWASCIKSLSESRRQLFFDRYRHASITPEYSARPIRKERCQLCHGKAGPVQRLAPGDWIVCYSPRSEMRGGEPVHAFTAIGRVMEGEAYAFDLGNGFVPTRRDVSFFDAQPVPIRPLIDRLSYISNKKNWAHPFRFGIVGIPESDFRLIAVAMGIKWAI